MKRMLLILVLLFVTGCAVEQSQVTTEQSQVTTEQSQVITAPSQAEDIVEVAVPESDPCEGVVCVNDDPCVWEVCDGGKCTVAGRDETCTGDEVEPEDVVRPPVVNDGGTASLNYESVEELSSADEPPSAGGVESHE